MLYMCKLQISKDTLHKACETQIENDLLKWKFPSYSVVYAQFGIAAQAV